MHATIYKEKLLFLITFTFKNNLYYNYLTRIKLYAIINIIITALDERPRSVARRCINKHFDPI